jgi:predicted dehydrogenase
MDEYRIGILGCGGVAKFHTEGWQARKDNCRMTALCDIAPSQIKRLKGEFPDFNGAAAEYTDYRDMLAKAPLDIVCVCSFSDRHLEHVSACLAAGKHVLMEKPVGYNLDESRRFLHLAHKHPELKVAVAYSLRYRNAFMDFRSVIRGGTLGEIITAEISYSHPHFGRRIQAANATAYLKQHSDLAGGDTTVATGMKRGNPYEDRGGNYITASELTHATHPWDTARYFLGEATHAFSTDSPAVAAMPDGGQGVQMGILWMRSGALVHVLAGSTRVPQVGGNQHQFAQVHGTLGSAWLMRDLYEPYEYHAYYRTDGEIQTAPKLTQLPDSSHGIVIRSKNLMDAIEGREELICSMEDGAHTTELLYALWLSERTGVKTAVLPARTTG